MRNLKRLLPVALALLVGSPTVGSERDRTLTRAMVENFYRWYQDAMAHGAPWEFQPLIRPDSAGHATLDFTIYHQNLRRLGFSSRLLEQEKEGLSACLANLHRLPYRTLEEKFHVRIRLHELGCPLALYSPWVGAESSFSGFDITRSIEGRDRARVFGRLFTLIGPTRKLHHGPEIGVTLLRIEGVWQIDQIEFRQPPAAAGTHDAGQRPMPQPEPSR